jgi:hypothetical protein
MKNLVDKIIRIFFRNILLKNDKFKNKHKGETCYIIGNGSSLKYMDLGFFSDHISIGINHICIHKDFHKLDTRYYVLVESFFFYPFIKNPYLKKYQENIFGKLFKKSFKKKSKINLFASLTNIFGFNFKNINYLYHFGQRNVNKRNIDISDTFSFMAGGLHAAVGLAISMGFKKAILIGCDYTFTPVYSGHFYSLGPPRRSDKDYNMYEDLFRESNGLIELSVITNQTGSNSLAFETYEKYTGDRLKYKENTEIVN